jgi:hypothetical protein
MSTATPLAPHPTPAPPRPKVPAEYVGRARALRNRFLEADRTATRAIDAATDRLRLRWQRHPVPRPDDLRDAARAWRLSLPDVGRLELSISNDTRSLMISELRVGASDFRAPDWQLPANEPGVLVQGLQLRVARRQFDFAILPLANVSLHALARRFQRGTPTEATLMMEMLALGHLATTATIPGAEIVLPVPGGRWVGTVAEVMMRSGKNRVLNVRTYKDR